jgi:hypothetical protein
MPARERLMVNINTEVVRKIALMIVCPWCAAQPGDSCVNNGVVWKMRVHAPRVTPMWIVFQQGVAYGIKQEKARHLPHAGTVVPIEAGARPPDPQEV